MNTFNLPCKSSVMEVKIYKKDSSGNATKDIEKEIKHTYSYPDFDSIFGKRNGDKEKHCAKNEKHISAIPDFIAQFNDKSNMELDELTNDEYFAYCALKGHFAIFYRQTMADVKKPADVDKIISKSAGLDTDAQTKLAETLLAQLSASGIDVTALLANAAKK